MATNLERYRVDLVKLLALGRRIYSDIALREVERTRKLTDDEKTRKAEVDGAFRAEYQNWYGEALALVRQITPDRRAEFEELYKGDGKRRDINIANFTIQDWLKGMTLKAEHGDSFAAAAMRFSTQLDILKAAERRFSSVLFDN